MRKLIVICVLSAWFTGNAQHIDSTDGVSNKQKEVLITLNKDSLISKVAKPYNAAELKAIMENKVYVQDGVVQVPYEPKSEAFLDRYMEIVYRKSQYIDSLNKHRMRFWKEPVNVFIDPSVPEDDGTALKEFANTLDEQVDSLKIHFVEQPEDSNYRVYYTNENFTNEYEANLIGKPHSYYIYWNQYRIYQGYLKINTQRISDPEVARKLMLWRFFNSLGYFNKQKNLPCSEYLSSCFDVNKELSSLDIEVLKYHYSYGICKGTRVTTFEEQHRKAKESLAKNPKSRFYFGHYLE